MHRNLTIIIIMLGHMNSLDTQNFRFNATWIIKRRAKTNRNPKNIAKNFKSTVVKIMYALVDVNELII